MISIPRLPWDAFFMLQAHLIATRSTCDRGGPLLFDTGRHGVGAVLVRDKRVIAGGYNGAAPDQPSCDEVGHLIRDEHCVRTIHSEINSLIQCALDETSPQGSSIYTTASPCYDCAKAIIRAGIRRVFFGAAYDSRYGLSSDVRELLEKSNIEVIQLELFINDLGQVEVKKENK
jgi:dCMP deaminase